MALTLTTAAAIDEAAGVGASAGLSAAERVVIGERVEDLICALTGIDWITNYSSLSDAKKGLLSHIVASKAGQIIANYDGKGYYSRFEQSQIMNFNDNEFNKAMEKLEKLGL